MFNRPGVGGAVLQTPLSWIDSVNHWSFSSKYSKHHKSQTVRARDLQFWHNVNHLLCVMCQMSFVMCHMSYVTYHMSHVTCPMLQFFSYLILYMYIYLFYVYIFGWQIGGTTWWRVCYKLSVLSSLGLSDVSIINCFTICYLSLWLTVTFFFVIVETSGYIKQLK